jgi:hypothetical protein
MAHYYFLAKEKVGGQAAASGYRNLSLKKPVAQLPEKALNISWGI